MKDLQVLEHSGIRVMTTEQLAEAYGCDIQHIKQNFNNNKDRFAEGKHYFRLEGSDLKGFKRQVCIHDLSLDETRCGAPLQDARDESCMGCL